MINRELLNPRSIAVIGGSNDIRKPGGKILKNILDGGFTGDIYVVNPKEDMVQGQACYNDAAELPTHDLAILAIAAKHIPDTVELLARDKNARAFIVISAGFSEEGSAGQALEKKLVDTVNKYQCNLIGPNCIGVLTPAYHGVFTEPVPRLDPRGCDFLSGSGATACFIMENGIAKGLRFASVFSVGNSAQLGVEDLLEFLDESFDEESSSRVKLLYLESISDPKKLLKHASSLIRKGCRIAAIKAGSSEAGSRAASSHTGALASSDLAVGALFRKAGIVRCSGREELINVASVFMHKELKGKRIGIITHAGGRAVMLTDALSKEGFEVPEIVHPKAFELLDMLYPGASVSNPVDFLATGTAEQLGQIIDYTDRYFDNIDGMAVIFGTPGLSEIFDVYDLLDEKMSSSVKPIFPILPSIVTARKEVDHFLESGRINFPDEVLFARALALAFFTPSPAEKPVRSPGIDTSGIRAVVERANNGYLSPQEVNNMLACAGIPLAPECIATSPEEADAAATETGFPLAMKVIGPLHKSDVGGVRLNIADPGMARNTYEDLMKIEGASGVLIQPMLKGIELFAGVKYEEQFGHLVLCGMGGIYIETIRDFTYGLAPLSSREAAEMVKGLKSYPILRGTRGQKGINIRSFEDILERISSLLEAVPEIREMDLNPLISQGNGLLAADARISIFKK